MEGYLLNPGDEGTMPEGLQAAQFDVWKDVVRLHEATNQYGVGTNEEVFIDILANRNLNHRLKLVDAYRTRYASVTGEGGDLIKVVEGEFSGYIRDTLICLLSQPSRNDCKYLYEACAGSGTDEDTLVEIICTRSVKERQFILADYKQLYGIDLVDVIKGDTSDTLLNILITVLTARLNEPPLREDDIRVWKDANELYNKSIYPHYIPLFAVRSLPHMRRVNDEYKKMANITVGDKFMQELATGTWISKEGVRAFGDIMLIINNKALYFASRILHAVRGAGTNDPQLIRVLTSRCDKDLKQIKESYDKHMGGLQYAIEDDTSGYYRACLVRILTK